jgi:anti-sigma-K factor RskA
MKYQDPQLRRALAAEYALGTLTGRSRRRFQKLLEKDPGLQKEVGFWEQRLRSLSPALPAIKPRPQVWVRIAQAIGQPAPVATAVTAPSGVTSVARETRIIAPPPANQSRFWQAWAGLATAAALVLAIGLYTRQPPPAPAPVAVAQNAAPTYVALLQMPNSTMHWAVSIAPKQGRIAVAANGEVPALNGKSVELWVISDKNGPVPIGVLPTHGNGSMPMPAEALDNNGTMKLAVSVEPAGGSPTGKPTGPIVIVTEAVQSA